MFASICPAREIKVPEVQDAVALTQSWGDLVAQKTGALAVRGCDPHGVFSRRHSKRYVAALAALAVSLLHICRAIASLGAVLNLPLGVDLAMVLVGNIVIAPCADVLAALQKFAAKEERTVSFMINKLVKESLKAKKVIK